MSKKHQKKKKHPKYRIKKNASKFNFIKYESPFKELNEEQLHEMVIRLGENSEKSFNESLLNLQAKILTLDPLLLLSFSSFYGLTSFPGKDRELSDKKHVYQHYVEFLQALILCNKAEDYKFKPIFSDDFEEIYDLIKNIMTSFSFRGFSQIQTNMSIQQKHKFFKKQLIQSHTMAIRNWGYPNQIFELTAKLFSPLEKKIKEKKGIEISYLIQMYDNIIKDVENRINHTRELLAPMIKANKINDVINAYHKSFPELKSSPDEMLKFFKDKKLSIDQVKHFFICHNDLRLTDIYTFSIKDFIRAYPCKINKDTIVKVLNKWSFSFGELKNSNVEHFIMNNPIWNKPIIKLEDNKYFIPILGLFLSFCVEIMEQVIKDDIELLNLYEEHRGVFLEVELENLFKISLPNAEIFRGSQWYDPITKKYFENDLLIKIDSFLIVIEAKSGKLTGPAKRGAELRLKNKIQELIVEPSKQANRFANFLFENKITHKFKTKYGKENIVDTSNIYQVIRLNVTFEDLSVISMRLPILIEAGYIVENVELVPSISYADLENILKLLNNTCEKLHYLVRRTEFENNADYLGDEMDLLAFYIETGFNIGETEFDETHLSLLNMSKSLDPYFMQDIHKIKTNKPSRKYTKWWQDILSTIEKRNIKRWSEIGLILLNCAYEDQLSFQRLYNQLKRKLAFKPDMSIKDNAAVLLNGPSKRRDVIVCLPYKNITKEERNKRLNNIAYEAMIEAGSDRAVTLAINIETNHYPYTMLGCIELSKGNNF